MRALAMQNLFCRSTTLTKSRALQRSVKITDRFTCTSTNVDLLHNLHIMQKADTLAKTGIRRCILYRIREHLRDVEKDDNDASKPVARHVNLPNHSDEVCLIAAFPYIRVPQIAAKICEQRFISQIGTLNPHCINERFAFN